MWWANCRPKVTLWRTQLRLHAKRHVTHVERTAQALRLLAHLCSSPLQQALCIISSPWIMADLTDTWVLQVIPHGRRRRVKTQTVRLGTGRQAAERSGSGSGQPCRGDGLFDMSSTICGLLFSY
mmetsp:Transcript_64782/g.154702  ORF Transcript_64782/g.154702 Transcript_64782/m.154702 type:complete len:124 (-) Transcript_64782:61-432(-)